MEFDIIVFTALLGGVHTSERSDFQLLWRIDQISCCFDSFCQLVSLSFVTYWYRLANKGNSTRKRSNGVQLYDIDVRHITTALTLKLLMQIVHKFLLLAFVARRCNLSWCLFQECKINNRLNKTKFNNMAAMNCQKSLWKTLYILWEVARYVWRLRTYASYISQHR